eukprot:1911552-Pyramimonas_sp.AAC.1
MIDFVAIPLEWCERVMMASPIHRLGKRVQVIKCRDYRDHTPVLLKMRVPHVAAAQRQTAAASPDG